MAAPETPQADGGQAPSGGGIRRNEGIILAGGSVAPAWYAQAECTTTDPDAWYPAPGDEETTQVAKAVCARCPVRDPCLELALRRREPYGIWGGLDARERAALLDQSAGDGSSRDTRP